MSANFINLHKSVVLYLFVLLSLASCDVIQAVDEVVVPSMISSKNDEAFIIKKGQHYSNNGFKKLTTDVIRFEAQFDSSAIYKTADPSNQADINKLYGMADCNSQHHTNSARFGWRWYNNKLEIHAYTYVNKQRASKLIRSVEIGQPFTGELRLEVNQYVFKVNDTKVVMPRNCSGVGEGYLLYPYFGGDEAAPHDVKIVIRNLN